MLSDALTFGDFFAVVKEEREARVERTKIVEVREGRILLLERKVGVVNECVVKERKGETGIAVALKIGDGRLQESNAKLTYFEFRFKYIVR